MKTTTKGYPEEHAAAGAWRVVRGGYIWLLEPSLLYWTGVGVHAGILRREYVQRAKELNSPVFLEEIEKIAKSEDISLLNSLITQRNQLKKEIRDRGNPLFKEWAAKRNEIKYGDPLGPDYDYLSRKQLEKHPEWTAVQVNTEILQGVARTNEQVNDGVAMLEYAAYGVGAALLLRLVLTMIYAQRGERMLSFIHVAGLWLLGGLAALAGFTFGVRAATYDNMLLVGLLGAFLLSALVVFVWDKLIFGALFSKLKRDIRAVDELRP